MKNIIKKILQKNFLTDLFQSKFVDLNQKINSLIKSNNQIIEINEENKTSLITVANISKLPKVLILSKCFLAGRAFFNLGPLKTIIS